MSSPSVFYRFNGVASFAISAYIHTHYIFIFYFLR